MPDLLLVQAGEGLRYVEAEDEEWPKKKKKKDDKDKSK